MMGSLSLQPSRSMWEIVDGLVDEACEATPVILVDVHAEATSEKIALARWLDGRVTAVIGTHTHVQTADARVQPGGTAAITDAGMTGPHDSVIGVKAELATHRMRTGMPVRFEVATGGVRIEGVLVECDPASGRATAIKPLSTSLAVGPGTRDECRRAPDEHEVADEHEPRCGGIELLHELPVRSREPHAGERAGEEQQPAGDDSRAPSTSTTSGRSQIRNWGEATLPNATKATTVAAALTREAGVVAGVAAGEAHPHEQQRGDPGHRRQAGGDGGDRAGQVLGARPEAQPSGIPKAWWSARRTPDPRLSIWSGRPACRHTLRTTPSGARIAKGR